MFQYTKYLAGTVALLLGTSLFAAEGANQDLGQDGYQRYFSMRESEPEGRFLSPEEAKIIPEAPNRPGNVSEGAFYAQEFLGSNKWVLLNDRYTVNAWTMGGVPTSMIDNTLPEGANALSGHADALLKWEHISNIWYEDGSLCHALPIWRAYCDTDIPEAMGKNFGHFLQIYESKFIGVPVDIERLENVLKLYPPVSHQAVPLKFHVLLAWKISVTKSWAKFYKQLIFLRSSII